MKSQEKSEATQSSIPQAEGLNALVSPTKATIRIAKDGIEAIDGVGELIPDLIFMDIQMPNMDGIQACEIIKNINSTIPIIALTANVMEENIDKYKRSGFDHCLGKNIDADEIFTLIQKYIS